MSTEALTRPQGDMTDLVIIPEGKALEFFTETSKIEPILQLVRKRIDAFKPDLTTEKGRKEIAAMAYSVSRSKTTLETIGAALAKEQKEIPKKIDATRRHINETLDAWRDEVRKPLDDFEAADEARMDRHRKAIERMQFLGAPASPDTDSAKLRARLAEVQGVPVGPECEEYETAYANTKADSLESLTRQIAAREAYEADQAELAELRAMRAAREESDRLAAAKREADEAAKKAEEDATKAKADAEERATLQAEQAAATARREAEEKATADLARAEASAQAEREAATKREADAQRQIEEANARAAETEARIKREAEEKAAAEAEATRKRESDREHMAKINRQIVTAFVAGGMTTDCARSAVEMIARGQVPFTKISY